MTINFEQYEKQAIYLLKNTWREFYKDSNLISFFISYSEIIKTIGIDTVLDQLDIKKEELNVYKTNLSDLNYIVNVKGS